MLKNLVKMAVPNPGSVAVGSTITLGTAPTGYQSFLAAFGAGATAFFMLSDGAGRTLGGVWTVNSTTPATATITEILFNLRLGGTAGETFSSACTAWNTLPAGETLVPRLGQLSGFRNRLINGAMQIDQRNGGALQTFASYGYSVDRWLVSPVGGTVTGQRVAGPTGYQYAYQINGGAGVTQIFFQQRIESINCADLVNKNVALSVVMSNSTQGGVSWIVGHANLTDNFGSVTTIASGTWTVTSSMVPYQATFNAGPNAANGIIITFAVGAQTSGMWKITEAQLESGSYATPFERMSISETLAMCQRYYQTGDWVSSSQTYYNVMVHYKVTKRAAATVTNSRSIATFGGINGTGFFYQNAMDSAGQNATYAASAEL